MKSIKIYTLIFVSIIFITLSGCATVEVAKDARGTGQQKIYDKPKSEVWVAMKQAVLSTGGSVVSENANDCSILADYGVGLVSWGERVGVFCVVISPNKTETEVVSKRAVSMNITASDWTNAIYKELDKLLE